MNQATTHGRPNEPVRKKRTDEISISIVVPAHNESSGLANAITVISNIVEGCSKNFEIIVVDDGSEDETFSIISEFAEKDHRIQGHRLSRNFGKEAALLCGLEAASGDIVITIDADLQHPPELIPEMIDKWRSGALIVHAVKRSRDADGLVARIRARMFNQVMFWLAEIDLSNSSDFKLLDRVVVDKLIYDLPERKRFYRGLAGWIGYPSATVEFDVDSRGAGKSQWTSLRLIELATTAIVSFTSAPLRIVTILGVLTLLLGFVVGTDAAISKLAGKAVSGFATLVITILIIGSFIMICLGILGEYVAKIYEEIKRRPAFFVAETVRNEPGNGSRETD